MMERATSSPWMRWTDALVARAALVEATRGIQLNGSRVPPCRL